jgi:proteasome lid subunit RPN8/RPN11
MGKEFIEECWFIYGIRVGRKIFGYKVYHASGTSGHVDFDWEKAMNPRLLGWLHTHPTGFGPHPSETDESTMRGWVRAKNKPLICGITCDGQTLWHEYYRDGKGEIKHQYIILEMKNHIIWGNS